MSEPNFEKIRGMSAGQLAMGLNLELHRRVTEAQQRYDSVDCRWPDLSAGGGVMLKEIKWAGHEVDAKIVDFCPSCGCARPLGHTADCRIAAVLKAVEGEV